ncbi:SfiI-subtelomeric fragment related protein family member, putative [Babesia caballi]|uniref:SfiI-subtelomeric related protein family member, putative n=1 Tax=Babesia caballi TaxID=5871 RepID=A0AAV4LQK6_BABCB|nr:SfiI-subtelomeric fragment related protein family member, putative [Babesia caballi]
MRWFFVKPYVRWEKDKLLHYPEVSHVDGKRIDWLYSEPKSRYDAVDIYGPNTIELSNLPMGRTPEYLQERLRRFFSKFGTVSFCRCMPHDLDPYQCNGTGYVTFRSKEASVAAASANLVLPYALHSKVIAIRHLDTDKTNDPDYVHKQRHYIRQTVEIARQLYDKLTRGGPCALRDVATAVYERNFYSGKWHRAGLSVLMRFGAWTEFLKHPSLNGMFDVVDGRVTLGLQCAGTAEKTLQALFIKQSAELDSELTVHWREGRQALPPRVQQETDELYHLSPLPVHLQLLSKSHTMYRIHDERHMLKIQLKQKRNEARRLARLAKKAG